MTSKRRANWCSLVPGAVGTACGVVKGAAQLTQGNWKGALWSFGGAATGGAISGVRFTKIGGLAKTARTALKKGGYGKAAQFASNRAFGSAAWVTSNGVFNPSFWTPKASSPGGGGPGGGGGGQQPWMSTSGMPCCRF